MREWKKIEGFDFKEIIFEEYHHIAKITINRERYRNAFTPLTTWEMSQAFSYCRESQNIRVVILTGAGDKAFCAGGDVRRLREQVLAGQAGQADGFFEQEYALDPEYAPPDQGGQTLC